MNPWARFSRAGPGLALQSSVLSRSFPADPSSLSLMTCSQPLPWLGVYGYSLAMDDPEEAKGLQKGQHGA